MNERDCKIVICVRILARITSALGQWTLAPGSTCASPLRSEGWKIKLKVPISQHFYAKFPVFVNFSTLTGWIYGRESELEGRKGKKEEHCPYCIFVVLEPPMPGIFKILVGEIIKMVKWFISRSYCMQYDRPLAWYCRLSVRLSVTLCIVHGSQGWRRGWTLYSRVLSKALPDHFSDTFAFCCRIIV